MSREVLFGLIVLSLFSVACATITDIDVDISAVSDRGVPGGTVEYDIVLTNYGSQTKYVVIQTTQFTPTAWEAYADPYNFYLGPGESAASHLTLTVPENEGAGPVNNYVFVISGDEQEQVTVPHQ